MSAPSRPAVERAPAWAFPEPQRHQIDNGLQVLTVDLPGQHVLSLRLGIPVPLSSEPRELEGLTWMVTRGLDEGTQRHSPQEFAEIIERHGVALGAGFGEQGLIVEMEVTADHFRPAIDVLSQCLVEATYPDVEVARLKRARLSEIEQTYAGASSRGSIEFARTYFRGQDRASRPGGGEPATIGAIDPIVVRQHYAKVMRPQGAVLVLAGDFSGVDADPVSILSRGLSRWTGVGACSASGPDGQGAPAQSLQEAAPPVGVRRDDAAQIVVVDRPGSAQSYLQLGRPGPTRRTHHGWGTYQVLAFLLGGSPQARIDAVLREERGYTYGMGATFRPRRDDGVCSISGAVRAEATADALAALREVLDLRGGDLSEQEVRHGADFVAKTAPGRYSTADTVAGEIIRLALDGLSCDFVTQTLAQARDLTRESAAAAWDEVAVGPDWTTIVVADAETHVDALQRLGLGPVRVVSAAKPTSS